MVTLAGCNNRPRPRADATYVAQAGWSHYVERDSPVRRPVMVNIKATFGTTACQNDRSATEACCTGCQHRRPAGAPP